MGIVPSQRIATRCAVRAEPSRRRLTAAPDSTLKLEQLILGSIEAH